MNVNPKDIPPGMDPEKYWEARKSVLAKMPPFPPCPDGGYSLIYPDCPWHYRDRANAGKRGAGWKYPTLTVDELRAMRPDVMRMARPEGCALAMWATAPMMDEARAVMAAWGFKYSTVAAVWIKSVAVAERLKATSKIIGCDWEILAKTMADQGLTVFRAKKGMGNWTRSNAEFLLLGTRGKVERVSKSVGSVIVSELREHSRKPDEARVLLTDLFGPVPRLEMFARESGPGWTIWGLEPDFFEEEAKEGEGAEDGDEA